MNVFSCHICHSSKAQEIITGIRDWEFGCAGTFSYYRCDDCHLVQLHPFPTLDQLKDFYPDEYTAFTSSGNQRGQLYNLLNSINFFFLSRKIKKMIPAQGKVLDVGCGAGDFLLNTKKMGARELFGVDFSQVSVNICRQKGIRMHQGLLVEVPEEFANFDTVFMINYIEHVIEPLEELKKAYQVLKPGGFIHSELPNFRSLDRFMFGRYWGGNHVPRHTFQFTPTTIQQYLEKAGFQHVQVTQDLNPGHLLISIQNWMQRNKPDLKNNPSLTHGRMKHFSILLLIFLPVNFIFRLIGLAGVMRFSAQKP